MELLHTPNVYTTSDRIAGFYWRTANLAISSFLQIDKDLTWRSLPPPQITCSKQLIINGDFKIGDSNPIHQV